MLLDHLNGISIDRNTAPLANLHGLREAYFGLHFLANGVRQEEIKFASHPLIGKMTMFVGSEISPIVTCAFHWFSVTLVNYMRLIALVDMMMKNQWNSADLAKQSNHDAIKRTCKAYVEEAIPEILKWRNKVAAHFAATDPLRDDNLGTLEQSVMSPISFVSPYFHVGFLKWVTGIEESALPSWALTKTYEDLAPRFWPEMKLTPLSIA